MTALVAWVWVVQDWDSTRQRIEDAYRARRYAEAVDLIRANAETVPEDDRPGLRFLEGAALNRLGRADEALSALDAADTLGFAGPELDLERGIALASLGRADDARAALQRAIDATPSDAVRTRAEQELRRLDRAESRRKPQFKARPLYGYDTNLAGLAGNQALAREVRRKSPYLGVEATLDLPVVETPTTSLRLSLAPTIKEYTGARRLSYANATLRADGNHALTRALRIGAVAFMTDAWTRGEGRYWHQLGAGPTLSIQAGRGVALDLWALHMRVTSFVDVPNPQDRDGAATLAGAGLQLPLGEEWRLAISATGGAYRTDGGDYDHNEIGVEANLTVPRFAGFEISLAASATRGFYLRPNSLTRFTRNRRDTITSATLSVSRPIEGWPVVPNITIRRSRWSSNVAAFDFGRWEVTAGIGWPAAAWSRED